MCRMCLVEVEGARGYPPACTTPVTDGMVCHTTTDAVKQIQDSVLEFLLINHPLDCPVCDRGGECPLQDQTLAFGPGESRFVEEKRHWEKPIRLSNLILLDRERCIQCARCTRFAEEIAGDALIDFVDRSDHTQVLNFAEQPFDSYFSGNTVQICPVGALTASQYRFRARPWDLSTAETSCTTCAVHCRGAVQSSSNRLVRLLGVDSEPVNHGWLCDKGRYGIEWVHSEQRILEPMVRASGELTEVSWPDALAAAADGDQAGARPARTERGRGARWRARNQRGRVRVGAARQGRHRHRQRRRAARRRPPGRGRARCRACRDRRLRPRGRDRAAGPGPARRAARPVPPHQACGPRARRSADRSRAGRARAVAVRDRRRSAPAGRGDRCGRARARDAGAGRTPRTGRSSSPAVRRSRNRRTRRCNRWQPSPANPMCGSCRHCAAPTCTARSVPGSCPASCPAM